MSEDLQSLAAEYVLGTLPAGERARLSSRLQHDPLARRAVRAWEERLQPLADAAPAETPGPQVWTRIEARISADPVASATPPPAVAARSLAMWRGLALGSSALAAACLGWIAVTGTFTPAVEQGGGRYVAVVDAGGREPALIAEVDTKTGMISVRSLAAQVPPGQSLELWHVAEGHPPRSLGILDASLAPQRIQDQPSSGPVDGQIAVTLEPAGGSPSGAPTGPVVYSGRLVAMEE